MTDILRLVSAEPVLHGVVKLRWTDGLRGHRRLGPFIKGRGLRGRSGSDRFGGVSRSSNTATDLYFGSWTTATRFVFGVRSASVPLSERHSRMLALASCSDISYETQGFGGLIPNDLVISFRSGPGGYVCAIRAAQLGVKDRRRRERKGAWRHLPQRGLHPDTKGADARPASNLFEESRNHFGDLRHSTVVVPPSSTDRTMLSLSIGTSAIARGQHQGASSILLKKNKVGRIRRGPVSRRARSMVTAETVRRPTLDDGNMRHRTGSRVTSVPGSARREEESYPPPARRSRGGTEHLVLIGERPTCTYVIRGSSSARPGCTCGWGPRVA